VGIWHPPPKAGIPFLAAVAASSTYCMYNSLFVCKGGAKKLPGWLAGWLFLKREIRIDNKVRAYCAYERGVIGRRENFRGGDVLGDWV